MELNDQITKDTFDNVEQATYQTYFLYDENGNFIGGQLVKTGEEVPKNSTLLEPTKKVGGLIATMSKPVFKNGQWVETASVSDLVAQDTVLRISVVKQIADIQVAIKQQNTINAELTKQIASLKTGGTK